MVILAFLCHIICKSYIAGGLVTAIAGVSHKLDNGQRVLLDK